MAVRILECRHCLEWTESVPIVMKNTKKAAYTFDWCTPPFFFFSYHKKMFFKFICLFLLFNCCYLRIISSRFTTINGVINFRFSSHLQMIIFSFCFTFYGYAIVNGEKFVNNLSKRYAIATSCSAHIYVVRRIP